MPAAILAPLPKHPGPLSKEVTKCHPAPPRQHPLAQTGANLGTPNTEELPMLRSIFSAHSPTGTQTGCDRSKTQTRQPSLPRL